MVGGGGQLFDRFAGAVAGTVHLAAVRVRDKVARIVSKQSGCAPEDMRFEGGRIYAAGARGSRAAVRPRRCQSPHWAPALLPEGEEPGLRETVFWNPPNMAAPDENDRINTSAAYGFRLRHVRRGSGPRARAACGSTDTSPRTTPARC